MKDDVESARVATLAEITEHSSEPPPRFDDGPRILEDAKNFITRTALMKLKCISMYVHSAQGTSVLKMRNGKDHVCLDANDAFYQYRYLTERLPNEYAQDPSVRFHSTCGGDFKIRWDDPKVQQKEEARDKRLLSFFWFVLIVLFMYLVVIVLRFTRL